MDTGFVTSKKQQQVRHSRWQSFQFRFNSSAEIVCNQSNFDQKMFAISRFFSLCDSSANPNCFEPSVFFQIADWGLICVVGDIVDRRSATVAMESPGPTSE